MRKVTGWVTARTLAGCGVVACLALPGAAPETAAPARAAAPAVCTSVPGCSYEVAAVSASDA